MRASSGSGDTGGLAHLLTPEAPWMHWFEGRADIAWDAFRVLDRGARPRAAVRFIRGSHARTSAAFFAECAAALQFPPYFGGNWDAFNDCLLDQAWLPAEAVVVVFLNAPQLLDRAAKSAAKKLIRVAAGAVQSRNEALSKSRARSLHFVWQAPSKDDVGRWLDAGMKMPPMEG